MAMATRPSFESLKADTSAVGGAILFKEAQDMPPGAPPGGMQPEVGQSPVTGNPDEMQAPESANQRQFEDDFGSLAYQFVQDRAPALMPYMLGFEVVDRNEDGSKAVGIFGYKVGDDFYYVPAFFLNNQVRGVDMILNKKTNQFIPLTEKWIDFVINKHSVQIGEGADNRVRETMRNPDLSFVRRPQVALGKIAEDAAPEAPWTPKEAWEQIKTACARLAQDKGFVEMLAGLGDSVRGRIEKKAESRYFKDFMEKVGGPEAMCSFLKTMHDVGFANAAMKLYEGPEAFWTEKLANASIHVDRMRKIAAARPKVRVVDSVEGMAKAAQESDGDAPAADLGSPDAPLSVEENARQIVEHDFTIEDARPAEETSQVTDEKVLVEFEHRFQPPEGPGAYNFVMSDGVAREGVLLNVVMSPHCEKGQTYILFEDDGNVLAKAEPRALLTTDFEEDEGLSDDALKKLYDRAVPMSDVEVGDAEGTPYLFVDEKGNAAGPFFITFGFEDDGHTRFATCYGNACEVVTRASKDLEPGYGFMDWDLTSRYHDFDGRLRTGSSNCCAECAPCNTCDMISIGSFSGMPKKTLAGVIIPQDWKALKLRPVKEYAEYRDGESREDRARREAEFAKNRAEMKAKYTFGTPNDILGLMRAEGVERIKVASDGTEFYVKVSGAPRPHGPLNYKSAAVDLVTRFGLRPRRAFSALDKAASGEDAVLLVKVPSLASKTEKKAQDGLVNVAMPAPIEQIPASDPYSGVPVYQSPYIDVTHGQFTGVPALPPEGGMTKDINIGGEMARQMGSTEVQDEHDAFKENAALPIDEEARRLAEEAAKAGQRHVFDQAAIGGLVKVYDTAYVVDSYIPEFMDTIDRLGRILFLFYWKHEDFNQRYGSDDVVQMEDSLRSVFKQLGELTLHLKEKAVQKE